MSFDLLRRIVSGKKSRLKDLELGVDLDLCYITNRIIVMGFPASGIQSLYRNPRKDVKRWLEARHGQNYKIYNFCPRTENAYEDSFFNNQVQRFPFPDHHPPPLSMIPLFVHDIDSFLELSSSNVAVIHCKAGKGRSGTMTLCYLLTLAQLPPSSKLKYSLCGPVLINSTPNTDILSEVTTQLSDHPELQASSSNSTTRPDRPLEKASQGAVATLQTGTDSTETNAHNSLQISPTKNLVNLSESDNVACNPSVYDNQMSDLSEEPSKPLNELNLQKLDQEVGGSRVTLMAQRILDLLKFHTAQRMSNPDSSSYGISIPSQRRWIKYWGEVLLGMDARIPLSTHAQVEIMWIKVYVGELASYSNVLKSQTKIAVQHVTKIPTLKTWSVEKNNCVKVVFFHDLLSQRLILLANKSLRLNKLKTARMLFRKTNPALEKPKVFPALKGKLTGKTQKIYWLHLPHLAKNQSSLCRRLC